MATAIQAGDRFKFRGLTGEVHDDVEIRVRHATIEGKVIFDVSGQNVAPFFAASYATCLLMIEQGIWEPVT